MARRWAVVKESERSDGSYASIGRRVHESPTFVRRTLLRWKSDGTLHNLPRSGAPRKFDYELVRPLLKSHEYGSIRSTAKELERRGKVKVSRETVRTAAHSLGLRYRKKKKKPLLRRGDRIARLAFANQARDRRFWRNVVAVDEHSCKCFTDIKGQWVEEGEKASYRETIKWPPRVKVWAGSSYEGKTDLHFISSKMNSSDYEQLLREEASRDMERLYPNRVRKVKMQQDGDGCHTAAIVQKILKKAPYGVVDDFPAHSPDLNWQENVWEMLDERVAKRRPRTVEGLKRVMVEEWEAIPMSAIRKCVESMPRRLADVIAARGGHTKY